MGWVKLDDQFARHPKVLAAGPLAGWLHVCALTYCAQYLTDGFVLKAAVNGLADFSTLSEYMAGVGSSDVTGMDLVADLLKSGMWSAVEGGYLIHDYLDFNPSRSEVLKKRQSDLERKKIPEIVAEDSARNRNGIAMDSKLPVPLPRPLNEVTPQPPQGEEHKKRISKPKAERVPITEQDTEELVSKYSAQYGNPQAVRDEIDLALNHVARFKSLNERVYVNGWLRRELEHKRLLPNGRAPHPPQNHAVIDRTGVPN